MPVSLDLRKAHKVRRHGDLLAIYTWVNDERALVLLPARRKNAAWFVVCESAAYRYDDASVLAAQCVKACEVLGVEPSKRNWVRIASKSPCRRTLCALRRSRDTGMVRDSLYG